MQRLDHKEKHTMINFTNQGQLDIKAAMTFGVSAKETTNPFGQFGTGLKYAVAILLRTGHEVTAYSGLDTYEFSVGELEFRGKQFAVVRAAVNGATPQDLGFTTHLGSHWKVWQAYRELYCNAMDELECEISTTAFPPKAGRTTFVVSGAEIEAVHADRYSHFLHGIAPLYTLGKGVTVHQLGVGTNGVFLKGVRVCNLEKALYSYDIPDTLELTEDRTVKYSWEPASIISKALVAAKDKVAIKELLVNKRGPEGESTFESTLEPRIQVATDEFKEVVRSVLANPRLELYAMAYTMFRRAGVSQVLKFFKPTALEFKMLTKASHFLLDMGMDLEDYPIVFVKDLGTGVDAQADLKERRILLTKVCFTKGTRYLASTLYEEVTHLATGHGDCCRAMQTHLFDTIIGMGEQLAGEPL